jgi:hypothetical protein
MKWKRIVPTLWALAVLGQIAFYVVTFLHILSRLHSAGNITNLVLFGSFDFLAVAFTGMSWEPGRYKIDWRPAQIGVYILTCIIVILVLRANILVGWLS